MPDLLVRAQELGGRWVSLGADSARGIVVEDFTHDADDWGPRSCGFTLRRRTDVPWPDIGALAPLEAFESGLPVWSGRVKGTPTTDDTDRRISVTGEGWQYHLDDDAYRAVYVDARMSDWVDIRGLTSTPLASFPGIWNIASGQAGISMVHPQGVALGANKDAAIILDTGIAGGAKRIVLYATNSLWGVAGTLYAKASDTLPMDLAGASAVITLSAAAVVNGVYAATFATAGRYVMLQIDQGATTPAVDNYLQLLQIMVFGDTTYEAFNFSALQAHKVILDALTKATLLLSSDRSLITSTIFLIPDFSMSGPATPREVITAANAYHDYQARVGVDKVPEYRPKPAIPLVQVDARSTFDEASAGDASEVYSGVVVNYTDAAGGQQVTARSQPALLYASSAIVFTNPGFETDILNWTTFGGPTYSRDTVQHDTGVASMKFAYAAANGGAMVTSAISGSFVPGKTYRLTFACRTDTTFAGTGFVPSVQIIAGNGTLLGGTILANAPLQATIGSWVTNTIDFQPTAATGLLVLIRDVYLPSAGNVWFDSFLFYEAATTIVDRRGFRRTKVLDTNMALTAAAAQQIADAFLASHRTTPLKGKLVVTGYGLASNARTGQKMRASELTLCVGELVRFIHLIDPDTGAIGREGRIASASYDADSDTTTLEIDSQSQNFEAMLARLALVTGQVPG